jgi:hemoglobin
MRAIAFVAVSAALAACASDPPPPPAASPAAAAEAPPPRKPPAPVPAAPAAPSGSLYDRLGGRPAITAVVDEFVGRVAADKRINQRFSNTDIPRLKTLLVEFVAHATGGPVEYTGRDMGTAHAGMDLVDDEFTALVEDLQGALVKLGVGATEQQQLLGALGPLKGEVVHPPPPEAAKHDPAMVEQARASIASLRQKGKTDAADLLEVAVAARTRGQRAYAEHLFSAAELALEPDALAALAPLFREGAPRRITTELKTMPADTAPQPKVAVGGSDDDAGKAKPQRGSLGGTVTVDGKVARDVRAVVMLYPARGKWTPRSPKQRVIEQRDRQFAPRLLAVPVGSTVAFPNFDPIYHNVFSRSQVTPFDLGIFKNGQSREMKFDKEGIVRIGCDLHANMSAHLVVVNAPHYAVLDESGHFNFRSLAPGKYRLQAWSERSAAPVTRQVEIKAGENSIDVDLHADARADLGTDKFGAPRGQAP